MGSADGAVKASPRGVPTKVNDLCGERRSQGTGGIFRSAENGTLWLVLRRGRCLAERRDGGIDTAQPLVFIETLCVIVMSSGQSLSQESKILDSSLYTREPFSHTREPMLTTGCAGGYDCLRRGVIVPFIESISCFFGYLKV